MSVNGATIFSLVIVAVVDVLYRCLREGEQKARDHAEM